MADAIKWLMEEIPDVDSVFMRAHKEYFRDGALRTGVFKAQDDGMSVNWNKYASKEATKQQATNNPENNAVISLLVGGIREIKDLDVKHTPESGNRAHSDVNLPKKGEALVKARFLLRRLAEIVIPLS